MSETITRYLTNNPCYKAGRTIEVQGLMLHSVGCPQPSPLVFIKNWDCASYKSACVHGFIGEDAAYITLPCMEMPGKAMRGWHGASGSKGSCNNTHIGVEMCEPASLRYTGGASFTCSDPEGARAFVKKTVANAAELFAQLCIFHGLDPLADGAIISHAEGYRRGIASNHGDPEHLFRGLGMDYSMDRFRADVKARVDALTTKNDKEDEDVKRYNTMKELPDWAKPTIQKLIAMGCIRGGGAPIDADGNPTDMDLSHDMVRVFVVNDRAGIYPD